MQALIASPPEAPSRACANCKNPMLLEQEWCLECGAARARRPSTRAGLRSGAGVAALTLLFVCGAVGASYAALAPTKKRTLRPRVVIAQVTMPPAGAAATAGSPTTAPGSTAPLATVGPPTTLPNTKLPKVPVTATPSVPTVTPQTLTPPHVTSPTKKPKTPTPGGSNNTSQVGGQILLDTNAASTYNPSGMPLSRFGDPAKAIDGDPSTSWTYTLDPARGGQVGAGLVVDLKSAQRVVALTITTPSPGMAAEFYGSASPTPPPTITDAKWIHIGDRNALKDAETITLKGKGHNFRYLVVWIPRAATGATTGSVGISEITVLR
ncbi:MAG: hypothetical protein ACR2ND_02360 [Solirubrobacteraceae bacterium]